MNEEIKIKWLEALRGGEYKQGMGYLRMRDSYCCLGVLTDLYLKDKNRSWELEGETNIEKACIYSVAGCSTILPDEVQDWAGLNSVLPSIEVTKEAWTLAELNDTKTTFTEIADLIEKQL